MKNEHIASSVTELIGKTPLLRASRFAAAAGISNAPLLKLEYLNLSLIHISEPTRRS